MVGVFLLSCASMAFILNGKRKFVITAILSAMIIAAYFFIDHIVRVIEK